jgi:hypothetical protein
MQGHWSAMRRHCLTSASQKLRDALARSRAEVAEVVELLEIDKQTDETRALRSVGSLHWA